MTYPFPLNQTIGSETPIYWVVNSQDVNSVSPCPPDAASLLIPGMITFYDIIFYDGEMSISRHQELIKTIRKLRPQIAR